MEERCLYCGECPASERKGLWFGTKRLRCNITGKQTGALTACFATYQELRDFTNPLASEINRKYYTRKGGA